MIQSIQNGTQQAAETMQKGMTSAQYSVTQVNKSADVLRDMALVMTEIDKQSNEIGQEIDNQNNHFNAVTERITLMEAEFNHTLDHLDHSLEFGSDLNKLSEKLNGMIASLKVTDTDYSNALRNKKRS